MPNPIYIPAASPEDWRRFLAEPDKQWVAGYSAKELAYAWHSRPGFPPEVTQAFEASGLAAFRSPVILLAIPEHQVTLPPTQGRPTQTDLFVLAETAQGLLSIAVEGKVSESFGPLVSEWFHDPSPGKKTRLEFLRGLLGMPQERVLPLRYQLLHRTAAALLEAKRFRASHALMLVHSFSPEKAWLDDYEAFLNAMGAKDTRPGTIHSLSSRDGIQLYAGWATGELSAP